MLKKDFTKLKLGDKVKIKDRKTLMETCKYMDGIPMGWGMDKNKCSKFFEQIGTIVSLGKASHKVKVDEQVMSIKWDQMDNISIVDELEPAWRKNARARVQANIFIEGDIYG